MADKEADALLKTFLVKFVREVQIEVRISARYIGDAENDAIERAEAVGVLNIDPAVTAWMPPETEVESIEEI